MSQTDKRKKKRNVLRVTAKQIEKLMNGRRDKNCEILSLDTFNSILHFSSGGKLRGRLSGGKKKEKKNLERQIRNSNEWEVV